MDDAVLKVVGPLCEIENTDFNSLQAFFLQQFDDFLCADCNKPLGLRPTVTLAIKEKHELFYCLGDHLMALTDNARRMLSDKLASDYGQVKLFETLHELRSAYVERIHPMVGRVLQGYDNSRDQQGLRALFAGGWRDFPSSHFVAAVLLCTTPLPGIEVRIAKGFTPESVLECVVILQVAVWLAFCESWSGELEEGRTLEQDLRRYLAPEGIMHPAAEQFLERTETLEFETLGVRFCAAAVRAILYARLGKANPRQQEWADLFVAQELLRRMHTTPPPQHLVAMEISAERARETIPFKALYNACVTQISQLGLQILPALHEIGEKAGHSDLAVILVMGIRSIPKEGQELDVDRLINVLRNDKDLESNLFAASKILRGFWEKRSPEMFVQVAEALEKDIGEDLKQRAQVEAWLCELLLQGGWPKNVLERIGEQAQPWEEKLSIHMRSHLWKERSNALRVQGRAREALAVAEKLAAELEAAHVPAAPGFHRELGMLYSQAGQHERALKVFQGLLADADQDQRILLLNSISVTYTSLGRPKQAIPYLEEAAELARGPLAAYRPAMLAALAAAKSAIGEQRSALELLQEISFDQLDNPEVLIPYASAWVILAEHPELLTEQDRKSLGATVEKLNDSHDATLQSGNRLAHLYMNRLLAILTELTQVGNRNIFWELLDAGAREFEGVPDLLALLALARDAFAANEHEKARNYLFELPDAVALRYELERDFYLKVHSLNILGWMFEKIVGLVHRSGSFEDLRLVAELQRDILGRIAAIRGGGQALSEATFLAPNPKGLARSDCPIAVFEWVTSSDGVLGLATFIAADGSVTETMLKPFEGELLDLARRVNTKLFNWHPGRAGDPFDLEEWNRFEQWLSKELVGRLPDNGQLVIIEHQAVAGLAWHVAAAPRWRVSYAPNWNTLHRTSKPIAPIREGVLGLVVVPKFRESSENLKAMEISTAFTVQLAEQLGSELKCALREACDHNALKEIFESVTVAKVICHGFVHPEEDVVALMVAYDGRLPLAGSVVANTPTGQAHRFNWHDCQNLKRAPAVLFSAACQSGLSHFAGLGEKLGLFSTLRRTGMKFLIAPRWNIDPSLVLPVLDNALERYLSTDESLGEALHAACVEASEERPRYVAWSLALEGGLS